MSEKTAAVIFQNICWRLCQSQEPYKSSIILIFSHMGHANSVYSHENYCADNKENQIKVVIGKTGLSPVIQKSGASISNQSRPETRMQDVIAGCAECQPVYPERTYDRDNKISTTENKRNGR
jgi:hypothetical protein